MVNLQKELVKSVEQISEKIKSGAALTDEEMGVLLLTSILEEGD